MNRLIYCIFDARRDKRRRITSGVGKKTVRAFVHESGLGAAISPITEPRLNIADALAYQKVVETLFQGGPVIPLRFGCVAKDDVQLKNHFARSHREYAVLLKELDGYVEMGIRLLASDENPAAGIYRKTEIPAVLPVNDCLDMAVRSEHPGRSYLAARKPYYARRETISRENSDLARRIRGAFSGLFVKFREESAGSRNRLTSFRIPLWSLYFLVPRTCLDSFCETFRRIAKGESAKLLLSGPWAPFNFVLPEREGFENFPEGFQ